MLFCGGPADGKFIFCRGLPTVLIPDDRYEPVMGEMEVVPSIMPSIKLVRYDRKLFVGYGHVMVAEGTTPQEALKTILKKGER